MLNWLTCPIDTRTFKFALPAMAIPSLGAIVLLVVGVFATGKQDGDLMMSLFRYLMACLIAFAIGFFFAISRKD